MLYFLISFLFIINESRYLCNYKSESATAILIDYKLFELMFYFFNLRNLMAVNKSGKGDSSEEAHLQAHIHPPFCH